MEFIPEGEPGQETPVVPIEFEDGELHLTWDNTTVRLFRESVFDHVEITDDDGNLMGIKCGVDFIRFLVDLRYPCSFSPRIDEETREWLINIETQDLEELTPEMFEIGEEEDDE